MLQGENPFLISGSRDDAQEAYIEARTWLRALPEKDLRHELLALHVKTVRANNGDMDLELTLEVYLAELKAYPGDVVRDVLRNWPGKFFPAWAELKDAITQDRRIRERRQRIEALGAFLDGRQPDEPERKPPTTAQIERNAVYVKRLAGLGPGTHFDEDKLARLAAVDELPPEKVQAPGREFKTIETLRRENGLLEKFAKERGLTVPK